MDREGGHGARPELADRHPDWDAPLPNLTRISLPPLDEQGWQAAFDLYRQSPQYQQVNAGMTLDGFKNYERADILLQVDQEIRVDAEKKQIKSAYYALAPEFHPDKYFRKRLGSYKRKIEAIFNLILNN